MVISSYLSIKYLGAKRRRREQFIAISKLFWLFVYIFFTRASSRGAHKPKNDLWVNSNIVVIQDLIKLETNLHYIYSVSVCLRSFALSQWCPLMKCLQNVCILYDENWRFFNTVYSVMRMFLGYKLTDGLLAHRQATIQPTDGTFFSTFSKLWKSVISIDSV